MSFVAFVDVYSCTNSCIPATTQQHKTKQTAAQAKNDEGKDDDKRMMWENTKPRGSVRRIFEQVI